MRVMKTIAGLAAALAVTGLLAAPADAAWHGHGHFAGGHGWHGGGHGSYHGHAWRGGYAAGFGGGYYAPYYGGDYGYGYPYEYGYAYPYAYGYREYDPGAAIALSVIGSIAGIMTHQAFRHAHYHHYRHHRYR